MMAYSMRKKGPVNICGYFDTVGEWKPILETAALTKKGCRIKLAKYLLQEDKPKSKEPGVFKWYCYGCKDYHRASVPIRTWGDNEPWCDASIDRLTSGKDKA